MLQVDKLEIQYNGRSLFTPISFSIQPGDICCLMGASGSGKSSIISAISGLTPFTGVINKPNCFTVFQDTNQLFPWFSIKKNLDLVCKTDYTNTVKNWNLSLLLNSKPNKTSGGQRQRFTLIRAMHSGCDLLLCDEPLSGLDSITKYAVLDDFKKQVKQLKLSCLWITHDLHEAKAVSNQILLLKNNGIRQLSGSINEKSFRKILDN